LQGRGISAAVRLLARLLPETALRRNGAAISGRF